MHANIVGLKKTIPDFYDPDKWLEAQVPGEVHLDLMRAGIIDSPYERENIMTCRWVEECYWFYRKEFDAPEAASSKFAKIVFDCLDYSAIIYLNGEEIGRHENAFYPCEIDVSGLLKPTGNILLVSLESGLFSVSEKPVRRYFTATMTVDALLSKRMWLRKNQSQQSWDWAPRLMNVGIQSSVTLKYGDELIADSTTVNSSLNDVLDTGTVKSRVFVSSFADDIKDLTLKLTVDGKTTEMAYEKIPADGVLSVEATVDKPALWWPAGYGEQPLYEVKTELYGNGHLLYSDVKKTGFRHVKVNQSKHPVEGDYFYFEINHQPVFMKGANLVPNDLITAEMTPERYQKIVELALEANFNFLRIWGGGLYESEALYQLCNERGILLWQEFISACQVLPLEDENLKQSICKEAVYQIRRLSSHPSLVAWCGNNENGWAPKGYFGAGDDDILYDEILPGFLAKEDPEKYYQPTSPYSKNDPNYNSFTTGDQHPWAVGFEDKDSRGYENMNCRFPNEGGILGPVSLKTMQECLRPGDGIHSFSWQVHDNLLESNTPGTSPDEDVRFWTGLNIRQMSIADYVYIGGFIQGEGLKRYIDNFRRRKYDSSSAVFWMYNDCWPAVRSWTIVDYYMRKTPSYHPVRRAFQPIAPVIAREDGRCNLYGINDTLTDWQGKVRYGVFTVDGSYLLDQEKKITIPANASVKLTEVCEAERCCGQNIAFACLIDSEGNVVARTRYTPEKYPELSLQPVDIADIKITPAKGGYFLSADRFVMGVSFGVDGDEPFGDNMIDLFPNQPYFVAASEQAPEIRYCLNDFLNTHKNEK